MNNKVLDLLIFILGIVCLVIMIAIFWNISIFIDEHNLSMSSVLGNYFFQYLYWIMGILTLCICGISIINFKKRN